MVAVTPNRLLPASAHCQAAVRDPLPSQAARGSGVQRSSARWRFAPRQRRSGHGGPIPGPGHVQGGSGERSDGAGALEAAQARSFLLQINQTASAPTPVGGLPSGVRLPGPVKEAVSGSGPGERSIAGWEPQLTTERLCRPLQEGGDPGARQLLVGAVPGPGAAGRRAAVAAAARGERRKPRPAVARAAPHLCMLRSVCEQQGSALGIALPHTGVCDRALALLQVKARLRLTGIKDIYLASVSVRRAGAWAKQHTHAPACSTPVLAAHASQHPAHRPASRCAA